MRMSIAARLLAAFLLVSLLPIGVLASLSLRESRSGAHGETRPAEEAAPEAPGEELLGVSVATVELVVAGASIALSIVMALFIGRTLVRPLRELERTMSRVEGGDLEARADASSSDEIGHLAASFNRMVDGLEREALVRDLFGQYVTPEVARLAIEQRGQLDGRRAECTVLFADIRDFTGISETCAPGELIGLLNRYFVRMSAQVLTEGGMVNKFGGDSLLALFGTPLNPDPAHAERAVRAALGMERELAEFNREEAELALPTIRIGIGIATGEVVAGNVGGEKRIEYTVIGDAVNLASRLQALTKERGFTILASEETVAAAGAAARFRACGLLEVRGKAKPVDIFSAEAVGERRVPTP